VCVYIYIYILYIVSLMQRAGEGDVGPGFEREVLEFIFTVMDKDNSKTLELSEVADLLANVLSIAATLPERRSP